MTLSEALKMHENDFVYIGAKSGYFYIGIAKDAYSELPQIEKGYLAFFKKYYKRYCDKKKKRPLTKYERKIYLSYKKTISSFKPFLDREVISEYKREFEEPLGTILIVDGLEQGDFWAHDEWLAAKEKEERGKANERPRNKYKAF